MANIGPIKYHTAGKVKGEKLPTYDGMKDAAEILVEVFKRTRYSTETQEKLAIKLVAIRKAANAGLMKDLTEVIKNHEGG